MGYLVGYVNFPMILMLSFQVRGHHVKWLPRVLRANKLSCLAQQILSSRPEMAALAFGARMHQHTLCLNYLRLSHAP